MVLNFALPALTGAAGIILAIGLGINLTALAVWLLIHGKLIAILIAVILGLSLVKKLLGGK